MTETMKEYRKGRLRREKKESEKFKKSVDKPFKSGKGNRRSVAGGEPKLFSMSSGGKRGPRGSQEVPPKLESQGTIL